MGVIFRQFVSECYPGPSRTPGCSSHRFEDKEAGRLCTATIARVLHETQAEKKPSNCHDVSDGVHFPMEKNYQQREAAWMQYRLCLAVAEYQIKKDKHFLLLGPDDGKIWRLKKGTVSPEHIPLPLDSPPGQGSKVDLSQSWRPVTTTGSGPSFA